ncbi:hypothetical protein Ddye_026284, partial [Dipteronia dyeriana]
QNSEAESSYYSKIEMATPNSLIIIIINCVLIASTLLSSSPVLAKSRRPVTDSETRQKKQDCYADIESGLWGPQCKSSMIATENCALRCLSRPCYELVYESDPLEEGENDYVRSQEYKYCMHNRPLIQPKGLDYLGIKTLGPFCSKPALTADGFRDVLINSRVTHDTTS